MWSQGTNPGFYIQQNTMRDALVAGITLDIFQSGTATGVKMASIRPDGEGAILQSVIPTEATL